METAKGFLPWSLEGGATGGAAWADRVLAAGRALMSDGKRFRRSKIPIATTGGSADDPVRHLQVETVLDKATHGACQPEIEKVKLIEDLNTTASSRQIAEAIERLAVSADAKSLLMDLSRVTIKLGDALISLGKKLLTFVMDLARRFPNTTFGLVITMTVSALISGLPVIGFVLGPILGKLLVAFGLTLGAIEDFKGAGLRDEIAALERKLATVAAGA